MNERPEQDVMTNPRADRVRRVARLAGRSSRLRQGQFLAEGPQSAREALRAHLAPTGTTWTPGAVVDSVYVSSQVSERDPELMGLVRQAAQDGVDTRLVTDDVLAAMSDAVTGQGIIAVCRLPATSRGEGGSPLAGLPQRPRLVAVLCRVQDPGNAGTILRAADAAGADAVVMTTGSVDVFNPKVVRSTAGSLFHLPVITGVEPEQAVRALWGTGLRILAADGYGSVRLDQPPSGMLARPSAWMFGNEAQGLSEAELNLADARVAVPLYGRAESLNVATAATVCLYASAMALHGESENSE
ncbi:TrmH family RNA methyltransferase [Citricoccus sp. GCM10030269]|uniref:TrmH family RNA methyltransferase n=1 Tax=Citricoccus sp. GCM10030269 TaxID=3273388 RepID=UPI0036130E4B